MFLRASVQKRCRQFWHFWLLKVKVTLQCFLLHLLTSFYFLTNLFLIMLLITIYSFSLSSNKLDNNFDCGSNLLLPMPSLLISNKKVLSYNWLATNNNFWCHQELKMWIAGALSEQMRFSFDSLTNVAFCAKAEHFYKNPLKRSDLKSQIQSPQNLVVKTFFSPGIISGTNEIHTFFVSNTFFNSASVLFNFLMNWASNIA